MNDTEWAVREVTVPWMNVRIGKVEGVSTRPRREDVDDEGVSGGVGILVAVAVEVGVGVGVESELEGVGSGGSSIFVYGIKAFGA